MTPHCEFNFCTNAALPNATKCAFHKHRSQCIEKDCYNQVYARNRCARHGGKRKCITEGCTSNAQGNQFCVQHGGIAVKRYCSIDGCQKQAQAGQKCLRHGGGRRCKVLHCTQYVRTAGLCHALYAKSNPIQPSDPRLCKYAYKPCPNRRAHKKDGTMHTLCEAHRRKTNKVQQQYAAKKRRSSSVMDAYTRNSLTIDPIPYEDDNNSVQSFTTAPTSQGSPAAVWSELRDVMDLKVLVLDDSIRHDFHHEVDLSAFLFPKPLQVSASSIDDCFMELMF
ncbi:hypothetical protein AeNC1_010879 [Aphanomyces euteiches]|nr:hypothetical protein AeNC1_010879 [Aphanomyces euteiches]